MSGSRTLSTQCCNNENLITFFFYLHLTPQDIWYHQQVLEKEVESRVMQRDVDEKDLKQESHHT
jgi:hypothetical protein